MYDYYYYGGFAGLAIVFAILMFLLAAVGLVCYILYAIGLMNVAKHRGFENAWLAWIPFGNLYLVGKMVPEITVFGFKVPRLELVMPLGALAAGVLSNIPFIGWIFSLAYFIFTVIVHNEIIKQYKPGSSVILSVFPFIGFFVIRNAMPVTPNATGPIYGGVYFGGPAKNPGGYYQGQQGYQQPPYQGGYQPPQQPQYQPPQYQPPQQPQYQPPQYQPPQQPQYQPPQQPQYQPPQYQPPQQPQYQPPQYQPPQPPQDPSNGTPPPPPPPPAQ